MRYRSSTINYIIEDTLNKSEFKNDHHIFCYFDLLIMPLMKVLGF